MVPLMKVPPFWLQSPRSTVTVMLASVWSLV
jgi:hypothetical protein